jgi:hypothetical protein
MTTGKTIANTHTLTQTTQSFFLRSKIYYFFHIPSNKFNRMREADKKTVFAVLKKSERDKKKLLETVLKQLRQLASAPSQM